MSEQEQREQTTEEIAANNGHAPPAADLAGDELGGPGDGAELELRERLVELEEWRERASEMLGVLGLASIAGLLALGVIMWLLRKQRHA